MNQPRAFDAKDFRNAVDMFATGMAIAKVHAETVDSGIIK